MTRLPRHELRLGVFGPALSLAVSLAGCDGEPPASGLALRRTTHGVVHVRADNYEDAGYGVGWAYAEDNRCLLAYRLAEVNGRLAEQLGADATVRSAVHDLEYTALRSDHYYRGWFDRDQIFADFEAGAPEVLALADGYAAGVNAYRAAHSTAEPCPVEFTGPVTREDMFLIWTAVATVASGEMLAGSLPLAAPASTEPASSPTPSVDPPSPASNAWALGRETVEGASSVHLYNPHFPWSGIHRLWMVHVTTPGELDVMGVALGGLPLPVSGFTEDVAWGLTFSNAARWVASEHVLDGDGASYSVDATPRAITSQMLSIPVLGEAQPRQVPFFRAESLPIVDVAGLGMGWTATRAFAADDLNAGNTRVVEQFLRVAQAADVHEVRDALAAGQGVPWSYTVASDREGEVFFGDLSRVPDVSAADVAQCVTSPLAQLLLTNGIFAFDGSQGACRVDGLLDQGAQPQVVRQDYVANSNNSYQRPNVETWIEGLSPVLGAEGAPLSLRASLGLRMIHDRIEGQDGLEGTGFTGERARRVFLQERNLGAEILAVAVAEDCLEDPLGNHGGAVVDLTEVCTSLLGWDQRNRVDSGGAVVFAGLWRAMTDPGRMFATPADPQAPLSSPSGYSGDPQVRQDVRDALARVAHTLETRGISPGVAWGQVHRTKNGDGVDVAMPGGNQSEGIFDAMLSTEAYRSYADWESSLDGVPTSSLFGPSYLHVVELGPQGPSARGVLPYGQATEPSAWNLDQLEPWSQGIWFEFPFTEAQIRADPALRSTFLVPDGR